MIQREHYIKLMHVICIICKDIHNLTLTCNANINMETVDTSQLETNCPKELWKRNSPHKLWAKNAYQANTP